MKNQDAVLKLAVATLDYSRDGLARVILSKILTAATDVRAATIAGGINKQKTQSQEKQFLRFRLFETLNTTLQSH